MKKRITFCAIAAFVMLVLVGSFTTISYAADEWRDITDLVKVSRVPFPAGTGQVDTYSNGTPHGMTIGRVVSANYPVDGYFGLGFALFISRDFKLQLPSNTLVYMVCRMVNFQFWGNSNRCTHSDDCKYPCIHADYDCVRHYFCLHAR